MAWIAIANYVTNFADQAVVLPLTFVVAVVLFTAGWRRGAVVWTATIGATLAVTLLLKIVLFSCGHLIPNLVVQSPSGHTAASGAVYGGLAAIVARIVLGANSRRRHLWVWAVTILVVITIATSRVMLGAHTVPEVISGGIIAVCGAVTFDWLAGTAPPTLRLRSLAAGAIIVVVLLHGFRMPAEAAIHRYAYDLWPLSSCQ